MAHINLLKKDKAPKEARGGFKRVFKFLTIGSFLGLIFLFIFITNTLISNDSFASNLSKLNLFSEVKEIVTESDKPLLGEMQGRINVLLLGIGGLDHQGTQLTDTIIIASLLPQEGKVALISIPRDLLVPIPGHGWRKINHVNALAELEQEGSGAQKTAELISDLFDIPLHYYVRIDFNGFIKVIDDFRGVDVFVENTLDDYQYPIRGRENAYPIESRFEHLHIEQGWQTMDGELALKYVRSRHAIGIEGSDFARSKRQQKVLSAFKKKVLSIGTAFSPNRINSLLGAYTDYISTDVSVADGLKLVDIVQPIEENDIFRLVLDNSEEGPLQNETITDSRGNKAYILRPKTGDFLHIQNLIEHVFDQDNKDIQLALSLSEEPIIEIQASETTQELQSELVRKLENEGFTHIETIQNEKEVTEETTIYDFTNGRKSHTISYLKNLISDTLLITSPSLSSELAENTQAHILIMLGMDSQLSQ